MASFLERRLPRPRRWLGDCCLGGWGRRRGAAAAEDIQKLSRGLQAWLKGYVERRSLENTAVRVSGCCACLQIARTFRDFSCSFDIWCVLLELIEKGNKRLIVGGGGSGWRGEGGGGGGGLFAIRWRCTVFMLGPATCRSGRSRSKMLKSKGKTQMGRRAWGAGYHLDARPCYLSLGGEELFYTGWKGQKAASSLRWWECLKEIFRTRLFETDFSTRQRSTKSHVFVTRE